MSQIVDAYDFTAKLKILAPYTAQEYQLTVTNSTLKHTSNSQALTMLFTQYLEVSVDHPFPPN